MPVLANLDRLEDAVAALVAGGDADTAWRDLAGVSAFLAKELERHLVQEEEALFPPMEEVIGETGGPTAVMRVEHVDMRRLSAELAAVVDRVQAEGPTAVPLAELQDTVDELSSTLRAHIYKEDNVLFPMADRVLSPQAQQQVAARMEELAHQATPRP